MKKMKRTEMTQEMANMWKMKTKKTKKKKRRLEGLEEVFLRGSGPKKNTCISQNDYVTRNVFWVECQN